MEDIKIQHAIEDLALIRRVIDKSDNNGQQDDSALKSSAIILGSALLLAIYFLIVEIFFGQPNQIAFIYSSFDETFMFTGLASVAIGLVLLSLGMVFLINRSIVVEKKDFDTYITKNFFYLKRMSFFSDLLIKFLIFCLVLYAKKPEWVSVVFTLFISDYLFQGRFFRLSLRVEIVLAILTLFAAIVQLVYGISSLIPALAIFCLVTMFSLAYIVRAIYFRN